MTRRINLLPPEVAQRRRARRLVAGIAAAGLGVVAVFALFYVVQDVRLRSERHALDAQEARNATLQAQIADLAEFDQLQRTLKQKTQLLSTLTQDEVRWSVVLADISLVIPSEVWLTSFTGAVAASAAPSGGGATTAASSGTIQMSGATFSHLDVAKWLTRLGAVDGFASPYLSLSAKASIGTTPIVNFTSSAQLSDKAFRRNQRGAVRLV